MSGRLTFRFAEPEDVPAIYRMIRELAVYEKLEDRVTGDEETLREQLFTLRAAEVLLPVLDGEIIGYALFFHNFSTFLCRRGLYLEDLYIRPEYRGNGYGKALLKHLAAIAVERGCGRMEWACLDWNEPSLAFYRSLGAEPQDGWIQLRLTGGTLSAAAKPDKN